jgi:hypothetical protein
MPKAISKILNEVSLIGTMSLNIAVILLLQYLLHLGCLRLI